MKQRIICLLAAACLLLAGCETGGGGVTTKPNFNTNSTPQQILSAAVEKTAGASSFVLTCVGEEGAALTVTLTKSGKGYTALGERDCGCSWFVSGADRVHLQCQTGQITKETADSPYTLQQILEELPTAEAGIWERFSQFPVMAELLANGAARYGVEALVYGDACWLIDGLLPPGYNGEEDDFDGYFFATVDASGYLTELSFKAGSMRDSQFEYRITLEKLNQKMTIETPWWAEK